MWKIVAYVKRFLVDFGLKLIKFHVVLMRPTIFLMHTVDTMYKLWICASIMTIESIQRMQCKWELITVYYEAFVWDIACILYIQITWYRKSFVRYGNFLLHSNVLHILYIMFEVNIRAKPYPSNPNDIVQLFENFRLILNQFGLEIIFKMQLYTIIVQKCSFF